MSPSFSFEAKKPQPRPQEDLIYSKRRKVIVDNPGNHPDPLIRDCNKPQALAFTTSTMPSQPSTQLSSEKVEPVNKQPPPAPRMSTDSDANELPVGQRAMRLRGGCLVRHSNAVSIPITYTFSRNWIGLSVGSAIVNFVFEEENQEITDATCNEAQGHDGIHSVLLLSSLPDKKIVICKFTAVERWLWTSVELMRFNISKAAPILESLIRHQRKDSIDKIITQAALMGSGTLPKVMY